MNTNTADTLLAYEHAHHVKDVHAQALMEHDGVSALGVDEGSDGEPQIVVYVDAYASAGLSLPSSLEGVRVVMELADASVDLNSSTDE